ncbi:MAG: hypothetical protein NC305_04760 [Lachnospiraceae bacterium]|nr:hypothetical protein [Muribaculum sp.]MCM1409843.1 hypothetical protein [Lachnospiraceae bacterium]
MKNNDKHTDKRKFAIISGLSALCIAVLAGAYFLTREPERDFTPVSAESANVTDTWEENSNLDTPLPSATPESTQATGTPSDNTQVVVSEDETGTTSSLSDSSSKEEADQDKPDTPPETDDDLTDPDKQPEYEPSVPQPTPTNEPTPTPQPEQSAPAGGGSTDDSHPGQVYDPVFGWVTPSNVQQDNVDSDGDINKQIGTMGGN